MKNKIIVGLVFGATFVVVILIMWFAFPDLSEGQSIAGFSGALGGAIGGVLGVTYLSKFRDERFTQIENRSAHNAFLFLLITLPLGGASIGLSEISTTQQAMGIVIGIWLVAIVIFWISMIYYYKR